MKAREISKIWGFILLLLLIVSCEKEKSIVGPDIPQNLFPLVVGREWIYDYKQTDLNEDTIPGRVGKAITKVIGDTQHCEKPAFIVIDSTMYGDISMVTRGLVHIDADGNLWVDLPFEEVCSRRWIMVYNRKIGLNKRYIAFDTTVQLLGYSSPIKITASSIIKDKITLSVPYGRFDNVFPGELEISFEGQNLNFKFLIEHYMVPDVGIIKWKYDRVESESKVGYEIRELRAIK